MDPAVQGLSPFASCMVCLSSFSVFRPPRSAQKRRHPKEICYQQTARHVDVAGELSGTAGYPDFSVRSWQVLLHLVSWPTRWRMGVVADRTPPEGLWDGQLRPVGLMAHRQTIPATMIA